MTNPNPNPTPTPAQVSDEKTGIPWIKTWKGAYLFVIASFVLWVLWLIALGEVFK